MIFKSSGIARLMLGSRCGVIGERPWGLVAGVIARLAMLRSGCAPPGGRNSSAAVPLGRMCSLCLSSLSSLSPSQ